MSYLQSNTSVIKNKVGLLNPAKELGNISRTCKVMGFSSYTFYLYQKAVEEGGVENLINKSKRIPNRKNRFAPEIEKAVVELATDQPAWGQVSSSNELRRKGISISPVGTRCVLCLFAVGSFLSVNFLRFSLIGRASI